MGNGTISWSCKLQPTVALSTVEAEYMALGHAIQELLWLRKLLSGISPASTSRPTSILEDNQGAIELVKSTKHHSRTKHIDVKHHFIKEKVVSGEAVIQYCPTEDMTADIMTKALPATKFLKHRNGGLNLKEVA